MKHAPFLKLLSGATLALALVSSPAIARDRHADQGSQETKPAEYPNATRKEPKLAMKSEREQKNFNDGITAMQAGDDAKATQLFQPLAEDSGSSDYAKSLALQAIANIKFKAGDTKGAIAALKQSLDIGALPNDAYFNLELELAQFYLADEQYQQAIDTVVKWRQEGKRETAQSYGVEGNAYYHLQKYPEAIAALKKAQALSAGKPDPFVDQTLLAAYSDSGQTDEVAKLAQQQVAANPNDKTAITNAVASLAQTGKYDEAIALEEKSRAAGNFTDEKDYVMLGKLHLLLAQNGTDTEANAGKAEGVFEEGLSKGILKPTAENYNLLGSAAYMAGQTTKAIDAYRKAVPLSDNGESAIYAGSLLLNDGKYSEAASLLKQGIGKGVKKKGAAYMLLAEAERGMKNKAGAVAAMKMAAQDPDTAAKAKAWLKKAGTGN